MSQKEQEIIKRQLNYYLAKQIDTFRNNFYDEDGIWSKYQAFTERFKLENNEVCCIKNLNNRKTEQLDLDTYCLGLNHKDPSHSGDNNFGAFSWWVEHYLKVLGNVGGTSSGAHGIYYYSDKNCYQNSKNKEVKEVDKTKLQAKFQKETYNCIKNKLGLSPNNGSSEDFECKPKVVVLNKIYYLFNMNKLDTKLIPIFKDKSLDNVIALFDGKTEKTDLNTWEAKSEFIYEKFEKFLNDKPKKDGGEALFKVPSEQERQKNANLVEIKDDNLITQLLRFKIS